MKREELKYTSRDGVTEIHAIRWTPEGDIQAVLQISHGMNEYAACYEAFAAFLTDQGFCVTANDHLGHGDSVTDESQLGFFGDPKGNECLLADMRTLHNSTSEMHPDVPYFMLGHSMGSYLVRQYITMFGDELAGVILTGTGYHKQGSLQRASLMARTVARARGWNYRSDRLYKRVFGPYSAAFASEGSPLAWITKDREYLESMKRDPKRMFITTLNGFHQMFRSITWTQNKKYTQKIPNDLPVLLASGAEDPSGGMGEGVKIAGGQLRQAGLTDVLIKLYPGDRHSILFETDRDQIYTDLLTWMRARFPEKHPEAKEE